MNASILAGLTGALLLIACITACYSLWRIDDPWTSLVMSSVLFVLCLATLGLGSWLMQFALYHDRFWGVMGVSFVLIYIFFGLAWLDFHSRTRRAEVATVR